MDENNRTSYNSIKVMTNIERVYDR